MQSFGQMLDGHVEARSRLEQSRPGQPLDSATVCSRAFLELLALHREACNSQERLEQAVNDCVPRRQGQAAAKAVVRKNEKQCVVQALWVYERGGPPLHFRGSCCPTA